MVMLVECYMWSVKFLLLLCWFGVQSAVLRNTNDVDQQGLYHKNDTVTILTHNNFEQRIYGKPHAWLVQFYNSNCGHCRYLAPKFKAFARNVSSWSRVVRVGVVDCFDDDNNDDCRNFEIEAYPTLRYFHENYTKANDNIGETLRLVKVSENMLMDLLITKLQEQQRKGHLTHAPLLEFSNYKSLTEAMKGVSPNVKYTFLVFDNSSSNLGHIISLETFDYDNITVRLVASSSELSMERSITRFPSLLAVRNDLQVTNLTPKNTDKESIIYAINVFLQLKNIPLPQRSDQQPEYTAPKEEIRSNDEGDEVRLDDLETALDTTLRLELGRHRVTEGEALDALRSFVNILINYFPFRANGKAFMVDFKRNLASSDSISGEQIGKWVKELTEQHKPIFSTPLKYVKCLGSEPRYRGHTCGLWTMFHTLTVAAATQRGGSGHEVLMAIHGYVKHFFACSDCSMHFQQMAIKNNMTKVIDKDKAVLWLWIAHNEVNLRLAGDDTEDPKHPKVQYPLSDQCKQCRQPNGAWRLDAVYSYLRNVYDPLYLRSQIAGISYAPPLSTLDFTLTTALPNSQNTRHTGPSALLQIISLSWLVYTLLASSLLLS